MGHWADMCQHAFPEPAAHVLTYSARDKRTRMVMQGQTGKGMEGKPMKEHWPRQQRGLQPGCSLKRQRWYLHSHVRSAHCDGGHRWWGPAGARSGPLMPGSPGSHPGRPRALAGCCTCLGPDPPCRGHLERKMGRKSKRVKGAVSAKAKPTRCCPGNGNTAGGNSIHKIIDRVSTLSKDET